MSSAWKIPAIFYRSASGDEPVREWLKALDKVDRQAIGEDIAYVQYVRCGAVRNDFAARLYQENPADEPYRY